MYYLFKPAIESALKSEQTRANATYFKGICQNTTDKLLETDGRINNNHDDFDFAERLVSSMGQPFKPKEGDWAGNYIANWRQVSSNAGIVSSMVQGEIYAVYQLGLNIRSPRTIGTMFEIAVQVWSMFGEYSSPMQDEPRR